MKAPIEIALFKAVSDFRAEMFTAFNSVEFGTMLLALRAGSKHGSWTSQVEALKIDRKLASRLMRAARMFRDATPEFFRAVGSRSKLFELLTLPGVVGLAVEQEATSLSLEDIAEMSTSELRLAVKAARHPQYRPPIEEAPSKSADDLSLDDLELLHMFRACTTEARLALLGVARAMAAGSSRIAGTST